MKPHKPTPAANPLLGDKDVQRILKIAEGLLNGTKRLVIESTATPEEVMRPGVPGAVVVTHYTHVFKVEDCPGNGNGNVDD